MIANKEVLTSYYQDGRIVIDCVLKTKKKALDVTISNRQTYV